MSLETIIAVLASVVAILVGVSSMVVAIRKTGLAEGRQKAAFDDHERRLTRVEPRVDSACEDIIGIKADLEWIKDGINEIKSILRARG